MMSENRQGKYMPLSNGFLSGAASWISYIFAAIFGLAVLFHLLQFWQQLQAGDIVFDYWLLQNWIWPILILNLFQSRWLPYPIYFLIALFYMIAIVFLEVRNDTLNFAGGLDLGSVHWTQIILLTGMLAVAPFLFLRSRKPQ